VSEFEEKVWKRLNDLEKTVERLKSEKSAADAANNFERLPATATVGKDYVAYRFGCTEEAVVRGRAGTHLLKNRRVSEKPLKWIKRDVDAVWREHTRPAKVKAAEERAKAKPVRKRSIIKNRAA
jgi:hypothetical protein